LVRNPEAADLIGKEGWDICAHGNRFQRHFLMTPDEERTAIAQAIAGITARTGRAPTGWQSRYSQSDHTRSLIAEHDCMIYDADSYADDLPYWQNDRLIVPHTFTLNDNRLATAKLPTGEDFHAYLSAAFRTLLRESQQSPRLMTISLHNRISGQPARFDALRNFLTDIRATDGVWFANRGDVARHFAQAVPCPAHD
jgi:peptidoglycan/xylan/chitin deacetylase (PgdA/CDA1 family)